MSDLVKKTIDGKEYEFAKFGAKKNVKLFTKLMKIVGEPIGLAMTSFQGKGPMLERVMNSDVIGKAMKSLCDKLDEDEVLYLMEELCGGDACLCNGKKIEFNGHYQDIGHLFKVFGAAVEVQFGSFLGGVKGLADLRGPTLTPDLQT